MDFKYRNENIYMSGPTRDLLYRLVEHLGLSKAAVIREAIALLSKAIFEGGKK